MEVKPKHETSFDPKGTILEELIETGTLPHFEAPSLQTIKPDGYLISVGLPPDGSIAFTFFQEIVKVRGETVRMTSTPSLQSPVEISLGTRDVYAARLDIGRLILTPRLAGELLRHLQQYLNLPTESESQQ